MLGVEFKLELMKEEGNRLNRKGRDRGEEKAVK